MSREHDAPTPFKKKQIKPGQIPEGKFAVIDHLGRHRGMVGHLATAATASRFLGSANAVLTKYQGKVVWKGYAPHE